MHSTMIIVVRAIIAFSFAISVSAFTIRSSSNSSSSSFSTSKYVLGADKMLLFGSEGRVKVIQRSEHASYIRGVTIATAEQHYVNFTSYTKEMSTMSEDQLRLNATEETDGDSTRHKIKKRCQEHTIFTLKPAETYMDWDIPMSGVILAPPDSPASVSVNEGFSITNGLGTSSSGTLKLITEFLKAAIDISYSKSWTATSMGDYSFSVPPGKFGAVVINPLTTRHSGYVDIGCIGQTKRTEFSGESYRSKSYSDLMWVEGLVGLCVGDTYPLKMCFGEGTL